MAFFGNLPQRGTGSAKKAGESPLRLLRLRDRDFHVEAIAEAAHASYEGDPFDGFDLLPEAEDVDVDRAVGDGAIMAPDGVEQLLPAENHSRAAHQEFQQAELGGGKRDLLAGQMHL